MSDLKCPFCGSRTFYAKDPDDEYETYEFNCKDGEISWCKPADKYPDVLEDTEAYCNRCTWHGGLQDLKSAQ